MNVHSEFDLVIIGGGIVGLATGYEILSRHEGLRILLLEKEKRVAEHQTGRNSGVIHSGIYYRPGSLKAELCTRGNRTMKEFCSAHQIPHETCGKLIMATAERELPGLERLESTGRENGVPLERLTRDQIHDFEPHAAGIAAIRVQSAGIVDFRKVAEKLAALIVEKGGVIEFGAEVKAIESSRTSGDGVLVRTRTGEFRAKLVINCAGLYADRVARKSGVDPKCRIVPFRGEYYQLKPEKAELVRGLIYPVPNPDFPFLGVHCTRMADGTVHLGPNAVLAFRREGYRKLDFRASEFFDAVSFPGLWKLILRHGANGIGEIARSLSRRLFVRSVQRLVPEIRLEDVIPCQAGVRAQALSPQGKLIDDFLIIEEAGAIHVCNAPSPAATASLEIGKAIADRADKYFGE